MKQKLQLLLLLWILFPANSKGAHGAVAGELTMPAYFFRLAPGTDAMVPGCVAGAQLLSETTLPVFRVRLYTQNRISARGTGNRVEFRTSGDRRSNGSHALPEPAYAVATTSVLLVATAFFRIGRRRLMVALLIVLTLVSAIIACYHNDRNTGDLGSIRFIRIAVTDKEGVRSYSEVVRVHEVDRVRN